MYRCGNKPEVGDCVSIQVDIEVDEMSVRSGHIAMVLELNHDWAGSTKSPLMTVKMADDTIQQIPATWCTLCERQ